MEGYKKLEKIYKLCMLKKVGTIVLYILFLLNAVIYYISPSILCEFSMLISLVSMTYLFIDYRGYW